MPPQPLDIRLLGNGVPISIEFKNIAVAQLRIICLRNGCPGGRRVAAKKDLYDTILQLPEIQQNAIVNEARAEMAAGKTKYKRTKVPAVATVVLPSMPSTKDVPTIPLGSTAPSTSAVEYSPVAAIKSVEDVVNDLVEGPFMQAADQKQLDDLLCNFIDRTSQREVAVAACAVCARETQLLSIERHAIRDIENQHLLRPSVPHPKHTIYDTMLLHPSGIAGEVANICAYCQAKLHANTLPKYALANNMWIGEIPKVLSMLSFPERLLIARYFPCAYIFKLYPKTKNARHWKDPKLYKALKGNVSTYRLDPKQVLDMVHPRIMPPPASILASVIGITFIGPAGVPEKSMPNFFRVQRQRIHRALVMLKNENPIYADIEISMTNLEQLPVDGIPEELMAVTRHTTDTEMLAKEGQGYVPKDVEDEAEEAADILSPTVDEDSFSDNEGPECDPEVIPMQALGVVDIDGLDISDSELMAHALANSVLNEHPKNFTVKRGSAFVNEYARVDETTGLRFDGGPSNSNHLLGSFPTLFPYGQGGFEVDRPVRVEYENHIQWALQYSDKRFRKDPHFPFQVFGVWQKRQVCRSAVMQMKKSTFVQQEAQIMSLTKDDLLKASQEETAGIPFSNPGVRALRKQLSAIRTRVSGTDESRHAIRSMIWGATLSFNPASLWITLNPPDTHDPIAQLMTGADINLDDFLKTLGPNHSERAENVTSDPYASAKYFHFVIKAIVEELFGFKKLGQGKISRKPGIYGSVQAYIGTVEAQGRGSLHLHMIIWLQNAPSSKDMKEALRSESFRAKLKTYVDTVIRADITEQTTEQLKLVKKLPGLSYSRPLDPRTTTAGERETVEVQLARSLQLHDCSQDTCYKIINGMLKCKRGVPFVRALETWVNETGQWGPKRHSTHLNSWNPITMQSLRGNQDVKLIMNGAETSCLSWYITNYATKKQQTSSNVSALLAKSHAFKDNHTRRSVAKEANKKLIQGCANTLTRDREFSAAEIMSLLMGWGDLYQSHVYAPIFLDSIVRTLKRKFNTLRVGSGPQDKGDEVVQTVRVVDGQLSLKDQLKDYEMRSSTMRTMSFLDFQLDTYEKSLVPKEDAVKDNSLPIPNEGIPAKRHVGRPLHRREMYLPEADKPGRGRIFRAKNHETIPRIVGRWVERSNEPGSRELYCATMLTLLKPWNTLDDLQAGFTSFNESWIHFTAEMSERGKTFTTNVDYYYECLDAASARRLNPILPTYEDTGFVHDDEDNYITNTELDVEDDYMEVDITDIDVAYARLQKHTDKDRLLADAALGIADRFKIFDDQAQAPLMPPASIASPALMEAIGVWDLALKSTKRKRVEDADTVNHDTTASQPEITSGPARKRRRMNEDAEVSEVGAVDNEDRGSGTHAKTSRPIYSKLGSDQKRAHDIVYNVLMEHLSGKQDVKQLLMLILGEGGTGKSLVIEAITESFAHHQQHELLAKCGTSGIAASNINGQTVHSWAGIGVNTSPTDNWYEKAAPLTKRKRVLNVMGVEFLILDELSMLTNTLLYYLSEVISTTRGSEAKGDPSLPFGGMHVILCGDFHQFPPVAAAKDALFTRQGLNSPRSTVGNTIYRQFTTVVILKKQMRVKDEGWNHILGRMRVGECTETDLEEIEKLVLTHPKCILPDFQSPPWNDCVLITPRHAVRELWNSESVRKHCRRTGNLLYIAPAEDTEGVSSTPISMHARKVVAQMNEKKTGKLSEIIEMSVGMKVMITSNISTEADIANGTQGVIADILLDKREQPPVEDEGIIFLKYPPAMVTFRPSKPTNVVFPGIAPGLVPLTPAKEIFYANIGTKKNPQKQRIQRKQFEFTPGYSFTDIKSQGQTIGTVLVDISKSYPLTPFHVYVALSRSRGRDTIRLLREFREDLLTSHPSEELREEMERLEGLNQATQLKTQHNHVQ